ncbi:MAG: hypothetical protein E7589_02745 [Ruminococcaceae bacterium]|nr:hypothetical protein [Oscillospiraceae bacterium]
MAEVYGDLLFLINMSMDYLCLHLSAQLLHRRISVGRLVVAAALGGVYSVIALLLSVSSPVAFAIDITVCLVMCAVAFWRRGEGIILLSGVYIVVSMVLGGIMTAMYNLLNRLGVANQLPAGEDGISAWMFAILAAISGVLALRGGKFFRKSTAARPCKVTIEMFGVRIELDGMCDSGNLMRDPMDGRLVIAVDRIHAEALLGKDTVSRLLSRGDLSDILDERLLRRLRLIPAGTAMGSGILVGISPDKISVCPEGGREREVNALFAIVQTHDGAVLVPSQLMM